MDNWFTGRRDRSLQTTEKVILYKITVLICQVSPRAYFLSRQNDVTASFSFGAWVYGCVFAVCVTRSFSKTTTNFYFILFWKEFLLLLELLWRPLDRREGRVAMLWLCLIRILNVHAVMIRVLVTTLVLRRSSARFVTISLNNRSYSWPPLPTGWEKNFRRNLALPPFSSIQLTLLSYRRLRARVTLVIEAKLPVKRSGSPLTSPLPRRNPAKRLLISNLTWNVWMTSGQSVLPA